MVGWCSMGTFNDPWWYLIRLFSQDLTRLVHQVLNLHGRQLRRIAPEAFDAIHGALADYYKQDWIYLGVSENG